MARFGCGDGRGDRFEVAHFAHEDDVRVLAERAADGLGEARDIVPDFTLGDERLRGVVVEFDRVFDRDDVDSALVVDHIEHRGESRGFTGACGTRDKNKPARLEEKLLHDRRKAELLHRKKLRRNLAQNHAVAFALLEDGHAEARSVRMRKSEVGASIALNLLHLLVGSNLPAESVRILLRERLVGKRQKLAVNAQLRRHICANVKVATTLINGGLQKLVHRNFHLFSPSTLN